MRIPVPFFQSGLQFECTRCSDCCRHDPGYVFLSADDLSQLAANLQISASEFRQKYCRVVDFGFVKRLSLLEKPNNDCIFWGESGCSVYEARPFQCRAFPFWKQNLEDKESWDQAGLSCPGINRGKIHSRDVIESWLNARSDFDLLEE